MLANECTDFQEMILYNHLLLCRQGLLQL